MRSQLKKKRMNESRLGSCNHFIGSALPPNPVERMPPACPEKKRSQTNNQGGHGRTADGAMLFDPARNKGKERRNDPLCRINKGKVDHEFVLDVRKA